jgi:hypothetical protein
VAQLIEVVYPGGERVIATGYYGGTLVVQIVPRGPEAALYDELACDFATDPPRVARILGGPRFPTHHVRVALDEAGREAWMDAREAEGWETRESDEDSQLIYVVATRADLDPTTLKYP